MQTSADKNQIKNAYSWLEEHGQIDYKMLNDLAKANTSESLEHLHELADDNNISYDQETDPILLAQEINSALESDTNTGIQ